MAAEYFHEAKLVKRIAFPFASHSCIAEYYYLHVSICVYLSVSISLCLSICVYLSVSISVCLSLCVYLSVSISVCLNMLSMSCSGDRTKWYWTKWHRQNGTDKMVATFIDSNSTE